MCSICGGNYPLELIEQASSKLKHRGPDGSESFSDGIFSFGHNRLGIIDLHKRANQPFISPFFPHLVLLFNGEIYNYANLKEELIKEGFEFISQSDTEVLLLAYVHWGEACLERLNGDFAFVVYDTKDKSLFLARDRLGNKPLFYTLCEDRIFFASEIKAFFALGSYELNQEEVAKWLLFGCGDVHQTIYKGIFAFKPGHYAKFASGVFEYFEYWRFERQMSSWSIHEALEAFKPLLIDALKIRLRADVKVALSVSGGIDSSILAHLAKDLGEYCYFGINFQNGQSEREFMDKLQSNLGICIHFIEPKIQEMQQDFLALVRAQDELFRSLSIYMQYKLFSTIAKSCKVAISGQGADELFGGYYHHIGRFIFQSKQALLDRIACYGSEAMAEFNFGLKCSLPQKLKRKLFLEDNEQALQSLQKLSSQSTALQTLSQLSLDGIFDSLLERFCLDFDRGLVLDTFTFSLPHLLRYEDRNAMAHGIENRTPFTDYRIVSFALNLDKSFKFQQGYSKYFLRLLLDELGSKELAWRKDKKGFSAPDSLLMQTLGYNCASLFDVRWRIFEVLKGWK